MEVLEVLKEVKSPAKEAFNPFEFRKKTKPWRLIN